MPILNGAEAAVVLKRMMPQTKIVLFTMHADIGPTLGTIAGVDLVLSKTEGLVKLDEQLNALLMPTLDTQIATKVPLPDDATPN
jgi:DNA-binding NarL/FixJ family response regulator